MCTLRLSLVGTVTLMLLGGLGGVVVAQDEDYPVGATHVAGTMTAIRTESQGSFSSTDAITSMRDAVQERDMEWSDPRLPSLMRLSENWDFHAVESDELNGAISLVQNVRLEGPDGAWTGTGYGLLEEVTQPEAYPQTVLLTLEGDGAYEGLSAMLATTYEEPPDFGEVADWEGYILEGGMTPVPEAPEWPAE